MSETWAGAGLEPTVYSARFTGLRIGEGIQTCPVLRSQSTVSCIDSEMLRNFRFMASKASELGTGCHFVM